MSELAGESMSQPRTNRVLANAASVIALLAEQGPTAPADIADAIGIARPTVYRLVDGLVAVELAEVLPDSRVKLSMRWLRIADAVVPAMPEWRGAQTILDSVADKTSQTAYLTVPRATGAVCIAWAQARGIDLLVLKPGRSLPFHAGAAGRATLANSRREIIEAALARAPFPPLTTHTITTEEQLRADIAQSVADGYTVSDEDVTIGIGAVGVPILVDGTLVGCVSVGGLIADIRADTPGIVAVLTDSVEQLAKAYAAQI
jgi:DNA-binding IclR family transcriptional regulator